MNEAECIEEKLTHINQRSIDEIQVLISLFLKKEKNYLIFIRLFLSCCIAIPEKIEVLCSFFRNILNSNCIENNEYFYSIFISQIKERIYKSREIKFAIYYLIENEMIPESEINIIRPFVIFNFEEFLAIDGQKVQIDQHFHHNQLLKGKSPSLIVEYIRNDDLDSLTTFLNNHNEIEIDKFLIEKNIYERCDMIIEKKCTMIDCSAFFGSIKCFKYLFSNSKTTFSTFKFAIMGGNIEIIHLIENKFDDITSTIKTDTIFTLSCSIKYHRTSIFEWLLNLIIPIESDTIQYLILVCNLYSNYQIFDRFLIQNMEFSCLASIYSDEKIFDWIITDSFFKLKRQMMGDKKIFASFKDVISLLFRSSIHNQQIDCLKVIIKNFPFIGDLVSSQFIDIIIKEYENQNFKTIQYLLNCELFDINMKSKLRRPDHFPNLKYINHSKSLLLYSCDSNIEFLIHELLKVNSININSACNDDVFNTRNAFDSCCENCSKEIVNLFLSNFKDELEINLPLHFSCRGNKIENFRFVLSNINIDINKVDHLNRTCLHYACECNNLIFLKELLSNQSTVFDIKDNNLNSPFFSALKNGSIECIKYLLSFNNSTLIDINETDGENKDTSLHIAAKLNNIEIIKLVLPNPNIYINNQNKDGILIILSIILLFI